MRIRLKGACVKVKERVVLNQVDFHADESEFVYIIGKVGSGKSSLLKTLFGELPIEAEEAQILDYDLCQLKRRHVPSLRRELGVIFQDFQLLADRTIYDNLDFVLRATTSLKKNMRASRIRQVLEQVGINDKAHQYPHEISGGEQQRAAIARALLNKPRIVLADEPTGNLDQETGRSIMRLLQSFCESGTTVVMITHNLNLLQEFPGIVYRCEGGTVTDVTAEYNNPISIEQELY